MLGYENNSTRNKGANVTRYSGYTSLVNNSQGYGFSKRLWRTIILTLGILLILIVLVWVRSGGRDKTNIPSISKHGKKATPIQKQSKSPIIIENVQSAENSPPIIKKEEIRDNLTSTVEKKLVDFHPTSEWQVIPENAVLPAGLEIQIDFETGRKMARINSNNTNIHHDLPVPVGEERTIVEQRLDAVMSEDVKKQREALDALDVEAHTIFIGEAITHSRNFDSFVDSLKPDTKYPNRIRLDIATILAGCLHNNPGAVEGALMHKIVPKILNFLSQERHLEIQRRLIAIITYLAETRLGETWHQLQDVDGLDILRKIIKKGMRPDSLERMIILLGILAGEGDSSAMEVLDLTLSRHYDEINSAYLGSFKRVCNSSSIRQYPNIFRFCRGIF